VLRGLERSTLEHIRIEDPYQTPSVRLRAGAYLLDWQPEPSFEADGSFGSARPPLLATSSPRGPVVVAAGQVTTVSVRALTVSNDAVEPAALIAAGAPPGLGLLGAENGLAHH
jgi:hypothetical protein